MRWIAPKAVRGRVWVGKSCSIRSVSTVIHQLHVKQFFVLLKRACLLAIVTGHIENCMVWSKSCLILEHKILYKLQLDIGHNSDGLCELSQINGVLPFTASPRHLIHTAPLYFSSCIFQQNIVKLFDVTHK